MGSDKALLTFRGQTLLERTLRVAAAAVGRAVIVGSRERYARFGDVIEDIYAGCGPLAGIHAALNASATDLNLVLSVDMPLLATAFLQWLVEQASAAKEWIVVPDALGGPQPLCGVYRKQVRNAAEEALQRGDYKIGKLFTLVPTRYITEQEMFENGFGAELFTNINTRGEYEQLATPK